jgi:hypothetical protein
MAVVSITEAERLERQSEIDSAIASVRLEGLEPSDEAKAIFQRYADGELTSDEMEREFDVFFTKKYGPVRLPGHERP